MQDELRRQNADLQQQVTQRAHDLDTACPSPNCTNYERLYLVRGPKMAMESVSNDTAQLVRPPRRYALEPGWFHQPSASEPALAVLCCIGRPLRQQRSRFCEADREGRIMFASIRKYNVRRGSAEQLARRVREGFVPMMRQIQGFRGYYLLDGGPDVLITISMFDSADEAFASN